jgi:hypothetical protein
MHGEKTAEILSVLHACFIPCAMDACNAFKGWSVVLCVDNARQMLGVIHKCIGCEERRALNLKLQWKLGMKVDGLPN